MKQLLIIINKKQLSLLLSYVTNAHVFIRV